MKNLFVWVSKVKNNKFREFQIYFYFSIQPEIYFQFALPRKYCKEYILNIDFLNILGLNISKNYKTDHAGFRLVISIFGLDICYNHIDCRHWDDDNNDWCKYPEDDEKN